MESPDRRWPRWVYGDGHEPDPRWSFANERTFLAWIRTSLALIAAGIALDAFDVPVRASLKTPLAVLLLSLGLSTAAAAWIRWARAERAMRRREPLPSTVLGVTLAALVVLAAGALVVELLG